MALPSDEVRAGDTVPLRVTLRPYAGREYVETVPVDDPRAAGRAGGAHRGRLRRAWCDPDVARAENLAGFIENLRSYYTASSIVVSLSLPEDGASLRGHLIPSLPPSAMDTLRTASADPPRRQLPGRRPHRPPLPAPGQRAPGTGPAGQRGLAGQQPLEAASQIDLFPGS